MSITRLKSGSPLLLAAVIAGLTERIRVEILRRNGHAEGYKLPTRDLACSLGDFAVELGSSFQPKGIGTYLRNHIGKVPRFDHGKHGKIERELGLHFQPIERSILDTLADLERWGHIPARKQAASPDRAPATA